jgi:hypothetical protein
MFRSDNARLAVGLSSLMFSVSDGERRPPQSTTCLKLNHSNQLHGEKQSSTDEIQCIALKAGTE